MHDYKIIIKVDPGLAALAGYDRAGNLPFDIKPSTLSVRQRMALASLPTISLPGSGVWPYYDRNNIDLGDPIDLLAILDSVAHENDIKTAQAKTESASRINNQINFILDAKTTSNISYGHDGLITANDTWLIKKRPNNAFVSVFDYLDDELNNLSPFERNEVLSDPRLDPVIKRVQKEVARLNSIQDESLSRFKKSDEELKNIQKATVQQWVEEQGTENQKKRYARNMLPESEVVGDIRKHIFHSLSHFPLYKPITNKEVWVELIRLHSCSPKVKAGISEAEVDYSRWVVDECEEQDFATLERIEAIIHQEYPDAVCSVYVNGGFHRAFPEDTNPEVTRKSIQVELTYGGFFLAENYAVNDHIPTLILEKEDD